MGATPPQPMRTALRPAIAQRQRERREHGGDVLIETFADLVRTQHDAGIAPRDANRRDELATRKRRLSDSET